MGLEFEIPFRELGFNGVPHRQTGFLMPSVNALVELIDMPFTVITMTEVNIVNLERVGFNLKNFDMTLVFKVSICDSLELLIFCRICTSCGCCEQQSYVSKSFALIRSECCQK